MKVVQKANIYLNLDFQNICLNIGRAMLNFRNVLNYFLALELI